MLGYDVMNMINSHDAGSPLKILELESMDIISIAMDITIYIFIFFII